MPFVWNLLGWNAITKINDIYRISQNARTLARLVIKVQNLYPSLKVSLDWLIEAENFDTVVKAAKSMTIDRDVPVVSLGNYLGNILGHVIQIKVGQALRENNDEKLKTTENFQKLFESEWNY